MFKKNAFFSDDSEKIIYYSWEVKRPTQVVVLVHDVCEHALRHAELGERLNSQKISMYALNLRGHGEGVNQKELGHLSNHGGPELILSDLYDFIQVVKKQAGTAPVILLGHGVGALLAKYYALNYGNYQKLILANLSFRSAISLKLLEKNLKSRVNAGENNSPNQGLTKQFLRRKYRTISDQYSWYSQSNKEQTSYIDDQFCDFPLTNKSLLDLVHIAQFNGKNFSLLDDKKPILVIFGEENTFSKFGQEARRFVAKISPQNLHLQLVSYPGLRQNILGSGTNERVFQDLLNFIKASDVNDDLRKQSAENQNNFLKTTQLKVGVTPKEEIKSGYLARKKDQFKAK